MVGQEGEPVADHHRAVELPREVRQDPPERLGRSVQAVAEPQPGGRPAAGGLPAARVLGPPGGEPRRPAGPWPQVRFSSAARPGPAEMSLTGPNGSARSPPAPPDSPVDSTRGVR